MKPRLIAALCLLAMLAPRAQAQTIAPVDSILAEAIVEASPDVVWAAWATSDGLRSWLAPLAEIDMRVGGRMRVNSSAQGTLDDPGVIENTVISFEPKKMLSIKVSRAPASFPFPNAIKEMWTVMYFEAAGPGQTRVRVVGLGFQPNDESQRMRAFFDDGNKRTLQQLQRHFAR